VTLALYGVPLVVKCSSVALPAVGSTVQVDVLGKAHVFAKAPN
jgi:hypothetical protein